MKMYPSPGGHVQGFSTANGGIAVDYIGLFFSEVELFPFQIKTFHSDFRPVRVKAQCQGFPTAIRLSGRIQENGVPDQGYQLNFLHSIPGTELQGIRI